MQQPENTPEELAALELYHQLVNLSPDNGDRAIMITLRLPNGRYAGDVWLSKQDINDLSDACVGLAAVRDYTETAALPAPESLDMASEITAIEDYANRDL